MDNNMDPVQSVISAMATSRLKATDLVGIDGKKLDKGSVSKVLSYKIGMPKSFIRAFHKQLDIPYDILLQDYELKNKK